MLYASSFVRPNLLFYSALCKKLNLFNIFYKIHLIIIVEPFYIKCEKCLTFTVTET